jgi:hypothetical protein
LAALGQLPKQACTFVTQGFPYGFYVKEVATTHMFSSPSLGSHIVNGIANHAPSPDASPRALLVEPEKLQATETEHVAAQLRAKGYRLWDLRGRLATTYRIGRALERAVLDVVLIASHGGRMSGRSVTIRYVDRFGTAHLVEFEQAQSFSLTGKKRGSEPLVEAILFARPVSLDGQPC